MSKNKSQKMSNVVAEKKSKEKKKVKDTTISDEVKEIFSPITDNISSIKLQLTALSSQIKGVERQIVKKMKQLDKELKKKSKGNKQPSGFAMPSKISPELCKFMEIPEGSEMARTEVTRVLTAYIRENKLQDPANGRRILADNKLSKLLKLSKSDELTYFNLQKHMSPHFAKKGESEALANA